MRPVGSKRAKLERDKLRDRTGGCRLRDRMEKRDRMGGEKKEERASVVTPSLFLSNNN